MPTRRRPHKVSPPSDILGEPRHGARHLIDFAEEDDGGEFGVWVGGDGGEVEGEVHGGEGGVGGEGVGG